MTTDQLVGIDVSAKSLTVEVSWSADAPQRLEFANSAAGHQALIKRLTKRRRSARVCLEATGVYGLDLAVALHRAKGIEVMVVNPRTAKHFAEALGERSKTDQIELACCGSLQLGCPSNRGNHRATSVYSCEPSLGGSILWSAL